MKEIIIRKETKEDYKKTEYMTLRAFWNLHGPGCNEHYLVNKLRTAEGYLEDMTRVAELDGEIVGAIMYSKAKVVDGDKVHEVLAFGPLCVEPTLHNLGIGGKLLKETLKIAKEKGYSGIIIYGEPGYYPKYGFKTCDNFGITTPDGNNFDAFMAYPLDDEKFSEVHGKFYEDEVFEKCEDLEEVTAFTKTFKHPKPLKLQCQWLHEEKLGTVCEVQKNSYKIKFWEQEISAKLKGSFYNDGGELPVVGDYVTFLYNQSGDSVITSVCERSSVLKRPDQSGHAIGYVKTMNEQVVVLTKSDLCNNPGRYIREIEELSDKVRVHAISALYGIGTDELLEYLKQGKTVAILGSSGVGKSTLVNFIVGEDNQ